MGVHDEQKQTRLDCSKRDPAFFIFATDIRLRQSKRIVKCHGSGLESDIVFAAVQLILAVIPFKSHRARQA